MRKDSNGLWSHKPGEAPAQNKDANGALIKDPKTAKISGQYTGGCADAESLIEGCIKSVVVRVCQWVHVLVMRLSFLLVMASTCAV
jgi:hypothetical protein